MVGAYIMSKEILLVALNCTYQHTAFGLRYLLANLNEFKDRATIQEYSISANPRSIVEKILAYSPKIVGFGVYIWNARQTLEVVSILKQVSPETVIVLGGPEVSHESEKQEICQKADYVIKGEADLLFYEFCLKYFSHNTSQRSDNKLVVGEKCILDSKYISGPVPDVKILKLPYEFYLNEDIKHRVIYIEASRGCPFKCEYCLSSLDLNVRNFELEKLFFEIDRLIERGARQFKFIDRTFNLSPSISTKILKFFLERAHLGLFMHFEMVPDRLPQELRELIVQFPKGALQFEIGVQTWNQEVSKRVNRRQDYEKIVDNFKFLTTHTGVHIHADLIVGLPGENLTSFAYGFDRLAELNPDEIQVGVLKKLYGAPIARHDAVWEMVYMNVAPYTVLKTKTMDFETIQKLSRFADFWNHVNNSGNFKLVMLKLKECSGESLFGLIFRLSEYLTSRHENSYGIALYNLAESLFLFLRDELLVDEREAIAIILEDYCLGGRRDIPTFLKKLGVTEYSNSNQLKLNIQAPSRQTRHLT